MKKNEQMLKKIMEQETKKFIGDARKKVQQLLQESMLSLLGLEKRYGNNATIDHCNNRNSVLISAFSTYAREEAEKVARSYKPSKEDITGFAAAFEKEFKSAMSYAVRDLAKERAKQEAERIIKDMKIETDKIFDEIKLAESSLF